jgi:hypothetical protein
MGQTEGGHPAATGSEKLVQDLDRKIEALKIKYVLFFSGDENIPPERDRLELEKSIRFLLSGDTKSARLNMLIQNLAAKFALFNNLWLKKLSDRETGIQLHGARAGAAPPPPQPKAAGQPERITREADINLNDERSFEAFSRVYRELMPSMSEQDSEKVVNAMKVKLISHNLVEARLRLSLHDGKLNIKIKPRA